MPCCHLMRVLSSQRLTGFGAMSDLPVRDRVTAILTLADINLMRGLLDVADGIALGRGGETLVTAMEARLNGGNDATP